MQTQQADCRKAGTIVSELSYRPGCEPGPSGSGHTPRLAAVTGVNHSVLPQVRASRGSITKIKEGSDRVQLSTTTTHIKGKSTPGRFSKTWLPMETWGCCVLLSWPSLGHTSRLQDNQVLFTFSLPSKCSSVTSVTVTCLY